MMTRKELQTLLKIARSKGLTQIKLTVTTVTLQAEYDRITAPEVAPETAHEVAPEVAPETAHEVAPEVAPETAPETAFHSFKEILSQRKSSFRPKAHGFKIVKEKRYDQLTNEEWLSDTLAFLDDDVIIWECDYIAA